MKKEVVTTDKAPQAIGVYSQALKIEHNRIVHISGQIPLDPATGKLVGPAMEAQIKQVFANLGAVAKAALDRFNTGFIRSDDYLGCIAKLNVYLTDLKHFDLVNAHMEKLFDKPYPARAVVQVAALPKGAGIEVDAVMHI